MGLPARRPDAGRQVHPARATAGRPLQPLPGRQGCVTSDGRMRSGGAKVCGAVSMLGEVDDVAFAPEGRTVYVATSESDPQGFAGGGGILTLARSHTGALSRLPGRAGCLFDRGVRRRRFARLCRPLRSRYLPPRLAFIDNRRLLVRGSHLMEFLRGRRGRLTLRRDYGRLPAGLVRPGKCRRAAHLLLIWRRQLRRGAHVRAQRPAPDLSPTTNADGVHRRGLRSRQQAPRPAPKPALRHRPRTLALGDRDAQSRRASALRRRRQWPRDLLDKRLRVAAPSSRYIRFHNASKGGREEMGGGCP